MSLGSLSQWQAALLTQLSSVDTDLPASVWVTVFIGISLFCQVSHRISPVSPGCSIGINMT